MKLDTSTDPQVGFRPPGTLEIASALDRYRGRFAQRQAAHLLRRTGFGPTPAEVNAAGDLGVERAVDSLLHPTTPDLEFPAYPDSALLNDPQRRNPTTQLWWLDRMLRTRQPLVEKLTLFWHGHFATSIRKVDARYMAQQINLFRSQALGNFRALLLAVSKDPAMLIWLDNRYNVAARPNENYAREVMELFALGLGNYTEDDIKSVARAFTGWTLDKDANFVFREKLHDPGIKTILRHTGPFGGEEVVNIIVSRPISQRFIARKLLEFFLYSDPEPELVDALAAVYAFSGYDIAKTVGTLLRSNVFYSSRAYRALPKSPIEFGIGLLRYMKAAEVPRDFPYWLARMGQEPLAPPSVKGWDGGPTWINTSTLLARFNFVNRIVRTAPPKPGTAAQMAPAAAASALRSPDELVGEAGGIDANRLLQLVLDGAVQNDVTSERRQALVDYLQSKGASAPVALGPENYQEKIRGLLGLVLILPANQLN